MFLKHLELHNVRCFEHLVLDFTPTEGPTRNSNNRKWTIVLGQNGTGKSTILRAAALITSGSSALPDLLGEAREWIRQGADSCRISATITTKEGQERRLEIQMNESDSRSRLISRAHDSLATLDNALEHSERNYFVAGYGSSRRLASEATFGQKGSQFRSVRAQAISTLFDHEASLNPLESWAMELDYQAGESGVKAVQSALSSFLPGMRFERIDKERKQLLFKTPDGSIPLAQLSDGYQNVAAWVGDLLFRIHEVFRDYHAPLKTRGLLIVDEIDLHLHPLWQRSVHDFLDKKLPNMQMLVTTHSPMTAQQAEANQIHYLKREGRSVKIRRFEADPSKLLVSQLLMTDAFGLTTDESVEIEDKKALYRKLRDIKQLSATQRDELTRLQRELTSDLETRRTAVTDTQMKRLLAIQDDLLKSNGKQQE